MLTVFDKATTSKDLYFKLNNSFLICDPFIVSPTLKLSGLYAIYKGDVCLYVGQSKNLASRLATHLTGKYENCDCINVFLIGENYEHFYDLSKDDQKELLEYNESTLINILNPIENIIVDRELEPDESLIFDNLIDGPKPPYCSLFVVNSKNYINVTTDPYHCLEHIDPSINAAHEELKAVYARNSQ